MMPDRRERILWLARQGRADGELAETLLGLVESVDRAKVEGFEMACDRIVEMHERWRKDVLSDHSVDSRDKFDELLGATPKALMDVHDSLIEEVRTLRRYGKPKPPETT